MTVSMQLSKFMALARSCPVSIGWIPKQSDVLRTALWTSVSSSSQGKNVSVHLSGFTFKLTPDESNSLSQIVRKFQAALDTAPGEGRCSNAAKCSSEVSAPLKLSLQVHHMNILIFSPSQPSVLSAQGTLLGLEAQVASCREHNTVSASVGSLLVTDKRALADSYFALLSMLPDSGSECLRVSYAAHTQPHTGALGVRSTTMKHQSAQSLSLLLRVWKVEAAQCVKDEHDTLLTCMSIEEPR